MPVQHYYWTPGLKEWPQNITSEVEKISFYGDYLSYLMRNHALTNVYITNFVKCSEKASNDSRVETNCFDRYLRRELELFKPEVVFCFSRAAERLLKAHTQDTFRAVYLYHPAAIYAAQKFHMTRRQMFDVNDRRIATAMRSY